MKIPNKRGRKPRVVDVQEVETQASPSLENEKLTSPAVASHSLSERLTRSQSVVKVQENIQHIAHVIEEIKVLSRRKKIKDDLQLYNSCHSCHVLLKTNCLACCSHESCSRYFCFRCLNKAFKKPLKDIYDITQASVWSCVSCQGLCKCQICKSNGRAMTQRKKFPSELVFPDRGQKKEWALSPQDLKTEHDILIKKEALEEIPLSDQATDIVEPLLVQEEPILKFEFIQNFDAPLTIPPCKPIKLRSRALAKLFLSSKKSQDSGDDTSKEEEEEEKIMDNNLPVVDIEVERIRSKRIRNKNHNTTSILPSLKKKELSSVKNQCHICQEMVDKSDLASCSIQSCQKHYCISCIQQLQRKDFNLRADYNPKFWICFSCGDTCECSKCKRRREAGKRRTKELQNAHEEMQQMQSTKASKLLVKRRIKYYDTLSEDEEEAQQQQFKSSVANFKLEEVEEDLDINQRKHVKVEKSFAMELQDEEPSSIKLYQKHCIKSILSEENCLKHLL